MWEMTVQRFFLYTKGGKMDDIVVYKWMVNKLQLKGNSLLVYAIIYADTRRYGKCSKTLGELACYTNATKQGIIKNIKELLDKGIVKKEEYYLEKVKFCAYRAKEF